MYIHIYIYSAYAHTYSFKPFNGNLCETRKGEPWCFRSCSRSSCFARLHCLHVVGLRLRREGLGFSFFVLVRGQWDSWKSWFLWTWGVHMARKEIEKSCPPWLSAFQTAAGSRRSSGTSRVCYVNASQGDP